MAKKGFVSKASMNKFARMLLKALVPESYKPLTMFPYRFVGRPLKVEVGVADCGLPFAEHDGVRVYFPRDTSLKDVETLYREYLEDEGVTGLGRRTKSPHSYVTEWHHPDADDVIVDIGCSEGFFSRSYATLAKRLYLFEAESKWTEPLLETFRDCPEKIVFTQKFVGAKSSENEVRLDEVLRDSVDDVFFLKLDVEGAEREILESSRDFLTRNRVKMSCCAYHRQDDGRYLTRLLKDIGFKTQYSEGWMLPYGSRTFPFFRHGVIYARNF